MQADSTAHFLLPAICCRIEGESGVGGGGEEREGGQDEIECLHKMVHECVHTQRILDYCIQQIAVRGKCICCLPVRG